VFTYHDEKFKASTNTKEYLKY